MGTQVVVGDAGLHAAYVRHREHIGDELSSEAGLADVAALVRTMRHTVDLATANLTAYAERITAGDWGPDGTDLFTREIAAAKWFATQLADDAEYLDVARERVERRGALAEREPHRRQRRRDDVARRRQERFNLLQTAIIGAVLMGLTAIQSLDYRLPVPDPAKPAIVAVLGAATFYLSAIALRLALGRPRLRSWLPWFEHAAAGTLAAAAVWLVVRWTATDLRGLILAVWLAVAFAVTAAGTAVLTARRAQT